MPPSDEGAPARVTSAPRGHSSTTRLVSEAMTTTIDATNLLAPFARRRTALLTSFRRDGTPVDTPVTIAVEDGHAYIRTYDRAWKARRMRNHPAIRLAPATVLGRPRGAALSARVELLDGAAAEHAARAI